MAYFDLDSDTLTTPDQDAENKRKVLASIAGAGRTSVLGNQPGTRAYDLSVNATNQPNVPAPRLTPLAPPTLPGSEFGPSQPVRLGQPTRPNVMPTREDFPAKPVSTLNKVLGIAAAPFVPALSANLLGGPRREAERQYQGAVQDWERSQGDQERQARIRNVESEIRARENPKPEKPENAQQSYADAVQAAIAAGRDPATDRTVQQWADAITSLQKQPAAPKENKAVAGVLNGKPAWGVQTDRGWVNPQNQQPIPGFSPAPSFAETGLYEPVELTTPGGGMVPGKFNRRSGESTPLPPAQAPLPKEAQKAVDESLTTARGMDRLERSQGEILQGVTKRGQAGPLGGGPYLTGPESMQFVANHIAMTFGSVKGARIGRDIIEQHVKARDLDQSMEAAAQRVLAGGVITYQQAQQMMETAKINRQQAWRQAQDAASQYGVPNAVKAPGDIAPAKSAGGFKPF